MKFLVIGDKETVIGFSLVGVEGMVVHSKIEARKALQQAVNRQDIGIILITERLYREIHDRIIYFLSDKKRTHLILQIPDTHGSLPDRCSVEEFVLSALGINV